MRIGITGTYSAGKTLTSLAACRYLGMPRTRARTMREILPEAAPGRTLEQCTAAELLQMIVTRHVERAVHEHALGDSFVSDGCSLQEWIYGSIRVKVGIDPNASAGLGDTDVERTPELAFFDEVMTCFGRHVTRHVAGSYDVFVHLRNELPLAADGHRPVNDRFRTLADSTLRRTLDEIGLPVHEVSGTLPERLVAMSGVLGLPPAMPVDEAVAAAEAEYRALDVRDETRRSADAAATAAAGAR